MNIVVTDPGAAIVEVSLEPSIISVTAATVHPELAGFFLEKVGEDSWTIWFEDGE